MEYTVDDKELDAAAFIQFANRIWPGNYDENKTRAALSKTINITLFISQFLIIPSLKN